jgi:hypothetical protein
VSNWSKQLYDLYVRVRSIFYTLLRFLITPFWDFLFITNSYQLLYWSVLFITKSYSLFFPTHFHNFFKYTFSIGTNLNTWNVMYMFLPTNSLLSFLYLIPHLPSSFLSIVPSVQPPKIHYLENFTWSPSAQSTSVDV